MGLVTQQRWVRFGKAVETPVISNPCAMTSRVRKHGSHFPRSKSDRPNRTHTVTF